MSYKGKQRINKKAINGTLLHIVLDLILKKSKEKNYIFIYIKHNHFFPSYLETRNRSGKKSKILITATTEKV